MLNITLQLAFGLIWFGKVLPEIGLGILLSSCIPGGGLGHLIVLVTGNANTELSIAINFLQIFVPLGKCIVTIRQLNSKYSDRELRFALYLHLHCILHKYTYTYACTPDLFTLHL